MLASGWHHHHDCWWIVPILLLLAAVVIGVLWRRRRSTPSDSARQILAERFARGEITLDEYRDRLAQLP